MTTVTLTFGGKSQTVDRAVVESQLVKAEARIADIAATMAGHRTDRRIGAAELATAEQRAAADIKRFSDIADACRIALA